MKAEVRGPASGLSDEIQDRLRRRFLDRLGQRMRRMRKDLTDRDWAALRTECRQIRSGGEMFGFPELIDRATHAAALIQEDGRVPTRSVPEVRRALEELIASIDTILAAEQTPGRELA